MSEEFENIKENVEEIKDEIRDEVNQAADAVEAGVNEAAEAVEAEVKEAAEAVEAEVKEAEQVAEDRKEEFKQKVEEMKSDVKEAYESVKEKTQSAFDDIKKEIDDYSDEMDADDVSRNKLMAVLAYIGPLVIVPLLVAKDSKFAKFHTNQGLILFLVAIVCSLLAKLKVIGWLFSVCGAVVFILAVVGIIYACQGKAKELPVVGNWQILK